MPDDAKTSEVRMVAIADLVLDGPTKVREVRTVTVSDYQRAMAAGDQFPPVEVYETDVGRLLTDGFHRVDSASGLGQTEIRARVVHGTLRDAVLAAVSANNAHGLRRSNADKRRSVSVLLNDDEWRKWSDGEIARRCGVSQPFVSKLRRKTQNGSESKRRRADGLEIDVTDIGRRARLPKKLMDAALDLLGSQTRQVHDLASLMAALDSEETSVLIHLKGRDDVEVSEMIEVLQERSPLDVICVGPASSPAWFVAASDESLCLACTQKSIRYAIMYFGTDETAFARAFGDIGPVWRPLIAADTEDPEAPEPAAQAGAEGEAGLDDLFDDLDVEGT